VGVDVKLYREKSRYYGISC